MRAGLASVIAVLGCSSQPPVLSSDVSTRDISLSITAAGDAASTQVTTTLDGPGPDVRLLGDDRLLLLAGGAEAPMARDAEGSYVAILPPGTVGITVRLSRAAPNASVDVDVPMPPGTAIAVPATASRAAPLPLTWTAAPGPQTTTLVLAGDCIPPISRPLSVDPGAYTLMPADLMGPSTASCQVSVTLTRALTVQSSAPPLQHAYVSVTQVATTTFLSTP